MEGRLSDEKSENHPSMHCSRSCKREELLYGKDGERGMKQMAIAMIIMLLLSVGCAKVENAEAKETSRFVQVEIATSWRIVADKETGVMYAVSCGVYNNGTFTLLVDADGNPLIYKGGQHGAD